MRKFLIPPNNTSYNVERGNAVVETQLDGGLSRRRKDVLGAAKIVTVEWVLDRADYLYLCAFFDTELCEGAHPFTIDLVVDTPILVERTVWFLADAPPRLVEQKGLAHKVTAKLEVMPLPIDDSANTTYLDAYEIDPDAAFAAYLATPEP